MKTSQTFCLLTASSEADLKYYLIANSVPVSTPSLAADIQQYSERNNTALLYLDSPLSALTEVSPYVCQVHQGHPLLERYVANAEAYQAWSGILLGVSKGLPFADLLRHLRQRLLVSFAAGRKGILHFSNPAVANYWFAETAQAKDTEAWLGPIRQVSWYGPEHSPNQGLWCKFNHTQDTFEYDQASTSPWLLSPAQELAFTLQNIDKALVTYFAKASITATDRQNWLTYRGYFQEAQSLGFVEHETVYQYLALCTQYHLAQQKNAHDPLQQVTPSLFEQLDIKVVQALDETQKLTHIGMLLQKDKSYVNG